LAQEIAEEYRAQGEAKGLDVGCQLPTDFPLVWSDAARIRQILGNLLSNAIKYTPSGGIEIWLALSDDGAAGPGHWAAIAVADTGPGIPEEKRRLVFEEFTRFEPEAAQGAGLGLAISERVAEALGGRITLESAPGEGSTFTLWLPVGQGVAG